MKYTTINSLCEAVADAIRSKEGSTELINPQDFVDRINALQIGGGGGEEYGVYLKILDADTPIGDSYNDALTDNSPEIIDFFSDAFDWLPIVNEEEYPSYDVNRIYEYYTIVAYEAQKKKMGLPNVYDSLPVKRIPILAVKTKPSYYENGDVMCPEQILILVAVYDDRSTGEGFYCNVLPRYNTIGLDYHNNSSIVINIENKGIRIVEVD